MATITVDELLTSLGYEVDTSGLEQYTKKTDEAEKETKAFGVSVEDVRKGVNKAAKVAAAAAVGIAAAMAKIAVDTANAGDEIAKMARATATAPDELQRLTHTADLSGVAVEKLKLSIITQNKLMAESRGKVTPFSEALGQLGLKLEDIEGLTTEERLGVLSDALNTVADDASRAALSGRLLGEKVGPELQSFIALGSKGIREAGDEAERLGLVMGGDLLNNSEAMVDAQARMKAVLTGLRNTIGAELLPVGIELLTWLQQFVQDNDELIKRDMADLIKGFASAVRVFLPFLVDMGGHIRTVINGAKELDERFGIVDKALISLKAGFVAMTFPISSVVILLKKAGDLVAFIADKIPGLGNAIKGLRDAVGLGGDDETQPALVGSLEDIRAASQQSGAAAKARAAKQQNEGRSVVQAVADRTRGATTTTTTRSDELRRVINSQATPAQKFRASMLLPLAVSREQTERDVASATARLGRATAQRARAALTVGSGEDKLGDKGGKGGGGGREKGKGAPGDFISDLLGETSQVSAGGGTAPAPGGEFRTLNAPFQPEYNVTVKVPGGAKVTPEDVGEAVERVIKRRDREIFDHYRRVVEVG